jgi:hypothetical protein
MLVMKANQLSVLAQTSANALMPRRELTDVTMGRQSQIIKFRRYSVMGPFARNLSEENSGLKFKWTHYRYSLSASRVHPRGDASMLSSFSSNCFRKIEAHDTLAP